MSTDPALLFVQADVATDHESDWNRWYDRTHVPNRTATAGFRSAHRYEVAQPDYGVGVNGSVPRYLALYDLDGPEVLTSDAYAALTERERGQAEDRAMLRLFRNTNRAVFQQIGEWHGQGSDPTSAGGLIAVGLVPHAGYEEEYNAWYDDEHIPYITAVPGVLRVRRFRALEGEPSYLAIWDLASPEVRFTDAFAKAADTPWSARVRGHCDRRLTALYRPWTSA